MATTTDTPVLDTLAAMTVDSIERCGLDDRTLILTRIAALASSTPPRSPTRPISVPPCRQG